jgi:hypothetical protein
MEVMESGGEDATGSDNEAEASPASNLDLGNDESSEEDAP